MENLNMSPDGGFAELPEGKSFSGAGDAAQVEEGSSNGGESFDAALAEFKAQNEIAQARNLEMMGVQVEEGTALKAAGLQVNPK